MKKILIVLCVITFTITTGFNQHDDDKRFCFEPVFGMYQMNHVYKSSPAIFDNENTIGYKFGLLKNIGIGQIFVVRPQVAFGGHKRAFNLKNSEYGNVHIYENNEFFINSSLHVSENFTNGSKKTFPYLVQGASYSLSLNMQDPQSKLWTEDYYNITIDIGGGVRFYHNRKHLFAVELVYSYGVIDRKFFGDNTFEETFNKNEARIIFNTINKVNTHYLTLQVLL